MIMLTDSERSTLEEIVKNYAVDQPYRMVVFGSRATGQAKKYSDLDIALIGQSPVPNQVMAYLGEALDNSNLPYTVDIIDFTKASPRLQSQIQQQGQEVLAP